MSRCGATKPDGSGCSLSAQPGSDTCWAHDPANREKRRRVASKGGRARGRAPSRDVLDISDQLQQLADGVLQRGVDRGNAAVVVQALTARLKALELLRRWRELGEVEERLTELERAYQDRRA